MWYIYNYILGAMKIVVKEYLFKIINRYKKTKGFLILIKLMIYLLKMIRSNFLNDGHGSLLHLLSIGVVEQVDFKV